MTSTNDHHSRPSQPEPLHGKVLYGLLGYPLGHSFSRAFFNNKFAEEGIDAEYLNFEIPAIGQLLQVLQEHPQLRGLNVTLPYKQDVIPYLDELSDEARAIGAVNVIRISHTSEGLYLKGFNSDIIGFMNSLRPLLQPHHKRALVLGTGGASKAICHGLERLGIEWRYVSRSRLSTQTSREHSAISSPSSPPPQRGERSAISSPNAPLTYSDLTPALLEDYTIIVNCTPLGMYPKVDACPDIPYDALTPRHLLYDLVYNPEETLFLKKGREQGAMVKGGLEMLHLQAIASWQFWNEQAS